VGGVGRRGVVTGKGRGERIHKILLVEFTSSLSPPHHTHNTHTHNILHTRHRYITSLLCLRFIAVCVQVFVTVYSSGGTHNVRNPRDFLPQLLT